MILLRLSEQPFALPHSLRPMLFKFWIAHLLLYLLEQILIEAAEHEPLGDRPRVRAGHVEACGQSRQSSDELT